MDVFKRSRDGYEKVSHTDDDRFVNLERRRKSPEKSNLATRLLALGGLFLLAILITRAGQKEELIEPVSTERNDPDAKFLHMLIHSNKKGPNLCKSLVSAGSLNYPMPSLTTWQAEFNDTAALQGGAQLANVFAVLDYLNMVRTQSHRHEDVVIIVDGYDTWFQLRPDVMLERFFEINRKANNRVVQRMGQAAMDAGGIKQRIVFGTQKTCSATEDDPACYAVPASPLVKDVDGKYKEGESYLSSGFIMGELGALHRLYERASWHFSQEKATATVQDVMSLIYGDQEYQRELVNRRYNSPGFFKSILDSAGFANQGFLGPHPTRKRPVSMGEEEFSIGLDYENLLSSSTSPDLDWLVRNDTEAMARVKEKVGVSVSNPIYDLPNDILRSLEPFWARNPSRILPQELGWQDMSLYTNLRTGVIPASIQHTSVRIEESEERNSGNIRFNSWKKMWFQPHMRTLLDEHVNEPYRSIAVLESETDGEIAWWPPHLHKWRLRDHAGGQTTRGKEWIPWDDVCVGEGIEEEVFRDGKGVWKVPRLEY